LDFGGLYVHSAVSNHHGSVLNRRVRHEQRKLLILGHADVSAADELKFGAEAKKLKNLLCEVNVL
jgi:hypothetical protein